MCCKHSNYTKYKKALTDMVSDWWCFLNLPVFLFAILFEFSLSCFALRFLSHLMLGFYGHAKYSRMKTRIMSPHRRRRHNRVRNTAAALQAPHFTSLVPKWRFYFNVKSNELKPSLVASHTTTRTGEMKQLTLPDCNWYSNEQMWPFEIIQILYM